MSYTIRIDDELKKRTQENFKKMGLDMSTATKMFYIYVDRTGKLPFVPSTGRTELEQAIYEADNHIYSDEYDSLEDFRKELYADED